MKNKLPNRAFIAFGRRTAERLRQRDPAAAIEAEEASVIVAGLLRTIRPRDVEILTLRYGLGGEGRHTLEATAAVLGVTPERVWKVQTDADVVRVRA